MTTRTATQVDRFTRDWLISLGRCAAHGSHGAPQTTR